MDPQPPHRMPLLLLRRTVIFPRSVERQEVTRPENLASFGASPALGRELVAVPVTNPKGRPSPTKLAAVGTRVRVVEEIHLADGARRLVLLGLGRVRVEAVEQDGHCFTAEVAEADSGPVLLDLSQDTSRLLALVRVLVRLEQEPGAHADLPRVLEAHVRDPSRFCDHVASTLDLTREERIRVLLETDLSKRLGFLAGLLETRVVEAEAGHELQEEVRAEVRRGYLRQQLEIIRTELGESDPREREAREFEQRIERAPLSTAARRMLARELELFRRALPASPEGARIRHHIEWSLELPWEKRGALEAGIPGDFEAVMHELDRSHCALRDVKQRVIEFLAVRHLNPTARGTVLCFLGPPGTGKSSMGRAVARALSRELVEIAVGGVDDEHELRGISSRHEDGAPGLILDGVHKAGTANPVVLIDEVDKLYIGEGGTAGGSLMQLLDVEQNDAFVDEYLGVPFDLSSCLFLVTANDTEEMPEALVDRLEVIEFGGYTESEKLTIAREHLLPRARSRALLSKSQFRISPAALVALIRQYTEEAGVRHLQRLLDSLCRKAAVDVVRGGPGLSIKKSDLLELLGPAVVEEEMQLRFPAVGIATGLAWTSAGGSLLPVEALSMPGSGRTILTGQVGEVLRESVQTSISFVRACFPRLGLDPNALDELDIHLHFPSTATPKDGPSAGIAIATAMVSLLARVPARHDIALTGEVSLHGNVLPVGGIRDKLLAAVRAGISEVVVPARNSEEVLKLPGDLRAKIKVHLIDHVNQAIELALKGDVGLGARTSILPGGRRRRVPKRARRKRSQG